MVRGVMALGPLTVHRLRLFLSPTPLNLSIYFLSSGTGAF